METTLGERIAIARKRAGLSQEDLATALGVGDRTTISKWEAGTLPDGRFMLKLPEVLHVSADWLFLDRGPAGVPTPPREALEAVRDWADQLYPKGGTGEAGGGAGNG